MYMKKNLITTLVMGGLLASTGVQADYVRQLGPTGLAGFPAATEITISKVAKGSPADGVVTTNDVIVGAGGVAFKKDARHEIADAIDQAETEAAKGVLPLMLKDGKTVNLQLKVLGSYSATAPYNSPKTEALIAQTAERLVNTKGEGNCLHVDLLGLLATGEQKYIDYVRDVIHKSDWAKPDIFLMDIVEGKRDGGYVAWYWGYTCLLLSEYYLLTGDEYVRPAIKTYAVALAKGQDAGGLWGHKMANVSPQRRLPGYAQINQPSLTCFIGMLLARKCGVKEPEVDRAIEKTYTFFASFIGKGELPYGVHNPFTNIFNNNGKCGVAAVVMSLYGDREGASFFSRLAATSYDTLEVGHGGYFFNTTWTPLGANVAGPEVTQQFFQRSRWLRTLARNWEGDFTPDSLRDQGSIGGNSSSGAHLLVDCLARRKLFITGKGADERLWLKGREAVAAIEVSQIDYTSKTADELIALFGHPLPQVRRNAVWTLRTHEAKSDFSPRLVTMMKAGTKTERLSAIGYFGNGCSNVTALARLDDLGVILRDPKEDPELRATAASAISCLGKPAYKYYIDMARLIVDEEPGDVFQATDESVGASMLALCASPMKEGLVTDKPLFYQAALQLVDHKRQSGRTSGLRLLAEVPLADFHIVADKVKHVIEDTDTTYCSYHNFGPVGVAGEIFAALNIAEGPDYLLDALDSKSGKWSFKLNMVMSALPKYGGNAKAALPRLKAVKHGPKWDAMVQKIEQAEPGKEKPISFEEARQYGVPKPSAAGAPLKETK